MRWLVILFLLTGCVVEQSNPREELRVEVSSYPIEVAPGAEFGIFIDVLDVAQQLETNVTPPRGRPRGRAGGDELRYFSRQRRQ